MFDEMYADAWENDEHTPDPDKEDVVDIFRVNTEYGYSDPEEGE